MKLKIGAIFLLAFTLSGCGGESDVTVPKPQLEYDQLNYRVFNLVYQGTELNSPSYKPLSLKLSFENSITGEQSQTTELPNYMFVEGSVLSIAESEENALDLINYELNFLGEDNLIKKGTFPAQFKDSNTDGLIFVTGDTTQKDQNYDVTFVQKPDVKVSASQFPAYFMNNSKDPVKVELYYAGALYSDSTQSAVGGHTLSGKIMLDNSEPDAELRITSANGDVISCSIGDSDVEDREKHGWLLAVSPLLYKSNSIKTCQPYSL